MPYKEEAIFGALQLLLENGIIEITIKNEYKISQK